jgi:hypothetical protein
MPRSWPLFPEVPGQNLPEGVLADGDGIIYGGWTGNMALKRYVKK